MTNVNDIRPGQAVSIGTNLTAGDRTFVYPWLYVVSVLGDTLAGVLIDNSRAYEGGDLGARFYTLTRADIVNRNGSESVQTHPLTIVPQWVDAVAGFLGTSRDVLRETTETAHVTPSPLETHEGDMIPRSEVERWKRRAEEIASEYADNNDLCGEFERCMEAIGLQSRRERERLYRVTYTGETPCDSCGQDTTGPQSVEVWVTARDDDHAFERLTDGDDMSSYLRAWDGDTSDVELERL